MKRWKLLEQAYERFLEIERKEWGTGEHAAIRSYTWSIWYKPSFIQFVRLVSDFYSEEDTLAGGLPRLHHKVQRALKKFDNMPKPLCYSTETIMSDPGFLEADSRLGQIVCDTSSRGRIAQILRQDFPYGADVALLGDDDLIGLAVADRNYPTVVYDIDSRLDEIIDKQNHIDFQHHDIRKPINNEKYYDAVLIDPADGSVALSIWLERADLCLSQEDGARMYLSINPWRLGRRWSQIVSECLARSMVPCGHYVRAKAYPHFSGNFVETDLWVFERTSRNSLLPLPYMDIEVFR